MRNGLYLINRLLWLQNNEDDLSITEKETQEIFRFLKI